MKKEIVLTIWILLLVMNLPAEAGDFIVEGRLGIGTITPSQQFEVTNPYTTFQVMDSQANGMLVNSVNAKRVATYGLTRTTDYDENDFGMAMDLSATRSGGVKNIDGLGATLAITHSSSQTGVLGGTAANFVFQVGAPSGSGNVYINSITGFGYALNRRYNIPSGLNYYVTNSYGAQYGIYDGGSNTGGVVYVTNHFGNKIKDYLNSGGRRVNITNLYGLYIEKMTGGSSKNMGIVLAGDGIGADLVLGLNNETKLYGNAGNLILDTSGKVGIGTTNPTEKFEVTGAIKVADTASQCTSANAGAIKFESPNFFGCNGTDWVQLNN